MHVYACKILISYSYLVIADTICIECYRVGTVCKLNGTVYMNCCTLLEPRVRLFHWPWGAESVLD